MNKYTPTVTTSNRHYFVLFVLAMSAVILLGRAIYLQYSEQEALVSFKEKMHNRTVSMHATRGFIADRNNEVLAMSIPVFAVCVNPQEFNDADNSIARLAERLKLNEEILKQRIRKHKDKQFVYVKRQIMRDSAEAIKELEMPGVFLQEESRRYYPMGEFVSHILGVTNIDGKGIAGLEKTFDKSLQFKKGTRFVQKDRYGRALRNIREPIPSKFGEDLVLSIDGRMQYRAYKALKAAMLKSRAKAGSIVALDPKTGEVLVMVNAPSFNPNDRSTHIPARRRNRAIIDMFEPGSTIKPLVMAALLQHQHTQLDEMIDTSPGYYKFGDKKVRDMRNYGKLSARDVLVKSSNVGISKLSQRLPSSDLWSFLTSLGFGETPGLSFPGESRGEINHHDLWRGSDHMVMAYGYGLSVSLLQLAHAYTTIANDGWQPTLSFQKIDKARATRRVIDAKVAQNLRQVLRGVVSSHGTAARAQVEGYSTAGKTGTVKKYKKGEYTEEEYISLFVGLAPASNPRLVIAVMIDSPKTDYYGGKIAAPIFAQVARDALEILGVPFDDIAPFYWKNKQKNILAINKNNASKQ
ncbi:MAG: peptidoglycan D,D-transpeptidase FtsI family protein [Candidatus Oxydemutatoraceae bacterium WSBS_2016_MAG_OTU14]